MLNVPLPANEAERQQALDRLELLDTPAAPYLDTLTRLAHDLFQVKTALVTLVDRDRQWFKSRQGLDVAQTPLSHSYCARAVALDEPLFVEDSQQDPRFAGSELAGQRAAMVMSLVQSAKLHGHDPWRYLKDVLERLQAHPNRLIDELLPHRWSEGASGTMAPHEEH